MDGTSCDDEGRRICVDGECMPVGCDGNLGSNTEVTFSREMDWDLAGSTLKQNGNEQLKMCG